MAVPKRKTTPSRRGMRRAHDRLASVQVITDPTTGEYVLPHHVNPKDGHYRGKKLYYAASEGISHSVVGRAEQKRRADDGSNSTDAEVL